MTVKNNYRLQKYIYYVILIMILIIVVASVAYSSVFVVGSGFLKATEQKINSPVFGTVYRIYRKTGDTFSKGEVLVSMRTDSGNTFQTITAPCSGQVVERFANEGEILTRGQSILLIEKNDYYVLAFFKESDLQYLVPSFPVKVVFKEGEMFDGKISRILPVVYPINKQNKFYLSDRRFIAVEIKLYEFKRGSLPYNAYAKVYISKIEVYLWKKSHS